MLERHLSIDRSFDEQGFGGFILTFRLSDHKHAVVFLAPLTSNIYKKLWKKRPITSLVEEWSDLYFMVAGKKTDECPSGWLMECEGPYDFFPGASSLLFSRPDKENRMRPFLMNCLIGQGEDKVWDMMEKMYFEEFGYPALEENLRRALEI